MKCTVSYSLSCADHGPMIADPERDGWICLGHELFVPKGEVVELIRSQPGTVTGITYNGATV